MNADLIKALNESIDELEAMSDEDFIAYFNSIELGPVGRMIKESMEFMDWLENRKGIKMNKCKNCVKSSQDEFGDLICVNADSYHCADFVTREMSCEKFDDGNEYLKNITLAMEMQ